MRYYLQTILKQNLWPLLICVLFIVLNLFNIAQFDTLGTFLLAFLIYDFNVGEKVRGTWRYFHSLPLTLTQKFIIKVILPMALYFIVSVGLEDSVSLLSILKGYYLDILISAGIVVLASILAGSLRTFILYVLGLALASQIIENIPYGEFTSLTLLILASYYFLSEARADLKKLGSIGIIAVVIPLIIWQFSSRAINRNLLTSDDAKLTLYAAKNLLKHSFDQEADQKMNALIRGKGHANAHVQKQALRYKLNHDIPLDLTADEWMDLFADKVYLRNILLRDLEHFVENELLNDRDLAEIESILLDSQDEDQLEELAAYIGEAMTEAHHKRIKEYLRSTNPIKVAFALEVIAEGQLSDYKDDLLIVIESQNIDNRDRAIRILLGQTKAEFKDDLEKAHDQFLENDTEENKQRLIQKLKSK